MNQLFKEAVNALGWGGHPMLQARSGCSGSGHCMQGCAINAKQSQLVTHIPASLALGARIYADLKADDFVFEGHRVTQLQASVIDRARNRPNGKKITVKAKHLVVAAGGFNTPAFLLNQPRLQYRNYRRPLNPPQAIQFRHKIFSVWHYFLNPQL